MPYKDKAIQKAFQARNYPIWYRKNGRQRASDYLLKLAEYRKQHRAEGNARQRVKYRIRGGIIIKPDYCSICGKVGMIGGHHPDYNKPLSIIWVCSSCHKRIHLGENLGGETLNL